jgi:hypothetical protein
MAERDDDHFDGFEARSGSGSDQPKRSWKDRLLSNRTARFVASTGVPLSMVGDDEGLGRLVEAVREFGWQISDTDAEADEILSTVPTRTHGYRAGNVVRGRFDPFSSRASEGLPGGEWSFIAFDAIEDSRLGRTVRQCVTGVPTMISLPPLRIVPARFPLGSTSGLAVYPTIDQVFDARYRLLAPPGDDVLATLTDLINDEVRDALCGGADMTEVWSHGSHLFATTSVPHDEVLLAAHLTILGALLRALRGR